MSLASFLATLASSKAAGLATAGAVVVGGAAVTLPAAVEGHTPEGVTIEDVEAGSQAGEHRQDGEHRKDGTNESLEGENVEILEGDGPDQNASDVAHRVWAIISGWTDDRGCEFGQTVAAAARGEDPDLTPCEQGREEELGIDGQIEETDEGEPGARGRERAAQARAENGDATQTGNAGAEGDETDQGPSEQGEEASGAGRANADAHAGGAGDED